MSNSSELEKIGGTGEAARLFPVLSESSKEGRTLSILLSVLAHVPEFSNSVLKPLGRPIGKRAKVEAFTEVKFPKSINPECRPDGLIVVTTGKTVWRVLVEAKIGTNRLDKKQVEDYLTLARDVQANALLTISNDFVASPDQHPLDIDKRLLRKTELFHVSWFSFLTALSLLRENDTIADTDHEFVLGELERFLVHQSAGLQRFTKMPSGWTDVLDRIRGGLAISKSGDEVQAVVESWHSELRDLCLLLSRKTGSLVELKLPRKLRDDPTARVAADCASIASGGLLSACFSIPNTASTMEIEADLSSRTLRATAQLDAPKDKARQASRLNWLTRQLQGTSREEIMVQSFWPGRAPVIEHSLQASIAEPELHSHPDRSMLPHSFAATIRVEDGKKFAGTAAFISTLEDLAIDFYDSVLSHLTAWQAPPPKLRAAAEELDQEVDEIE
ncbi:MAG: hypothetical protein ABJI41_13345 [Erythrobacter sp.]